MERIIKAALLALVGWAVESEGVKVKRPGVFVEVLRDRQSYMEVDRSSVDKVDKVECICRLAL